MSVSVKLYCKKSKRKSDGTAPVYIILRINNKEKLITTGKCVKHDNFDNHSGKAGKAEVDLLPLTGGKKIGRFNNLLNLTL